MPEETEPTPTSEDPNAVPVPVETFYGPNRPVGEAEKPTELRTSLGAILLATGLIIGTAFAGGWLLKPTEKIQTTPPPEKTVTTEDGKKEERQKSAFSPDEGYYSRENIRSGPETAALRIGKANKKIFWITGDPSNQTILNALVAAKNRSGMPIYILCGKETPTRRIATAREYGLPVFQVNQELETPYSYVLIDNNRLIDTSRDHWIWESLEPKVIESAIKWADGLIESAKVK